MSREAVERSGLGLLASFRCITNKISYAELEVNITGVEADV